MKRDMDLVRKILMDFEASDKFQTTDPIEGGHVAIMQDAGLVEASVQRMRDGYSAAILRITWAGHDFLDNARSPEIWQKLKERLHDKAASVSFDIIMALLRATVNASLGL